MRKGSILSNQIVVQEIPEIEEKTLAGIIVPKQVVKHPTTKARIVLVGENTPDDLITLKEGMIVLYPPMSAQKFTLDDQDYALLPKSRVLFAYSEA